MDLANNKNWLIFWHAPLNYFVNNHVYLNYDTNYFSIDASDNLTFNDFWKKDVSNNLFYTSGKIGIGVTKPNYDLDVLNNINCFEIYRNGTPLSSVLSLFLPLTGGILTGNLTGTTISASHVSATKLAGFGENISNLDNNNNC